MVIVAEISHSFLGTYRRTCGLVGVDVVKIFGNGVKLYGTEKNKKVQCERGDGHTCTLAC